MKKHVKIYLNHFGCGDFIRCEVCNFMAVDIHHIKYKSRGGKDELSNLMALCRNCHNKAHDEEYKEDYLKDLHIKYLMNES